MLFQKQDLTEDHYTWNNETVKFMGQPTRRLFDRFNGDQVLFLINFYGSLSNQFSLEEGRKIEHRISHQLPLDIKSEISVFNWIRESELV